MEYIEIFWGRVTRILLSSTVVSLIPTWENVGYSVLVTKQMPPNTQCLKKSAESRETECLGVNLKKLFKKYIYV